VIARATRARGGGRISIEEQRHRIITINCFLNDIGHWGWPEAPPGRLVFPKDIPRRPQPLPRYLPVDEDRWLADALHRSPRALAANALLLARAMGIRIGELIDLELDCVHEVPGQGAWLKVPLGKLKTERMVPLDDDTVAIVDRIVEVRSPGLPLPHPRYGRRVEFLLTHHGKRITNYTLRRELQRAAKQAGLSPIVPHQVRHTTSPPPRLSGLSPLLVEALTIMAARSLQPADLSDAAADVRGLMQTMERNRLRRLQACGFDSATARHLSDLHTPNLM